MICTVKLFLLCVLIRTVQVETIEPFHNNHEDERISKRVQEGVEARSCLELLSSGHNHSGVYSLKLDRGVIEVYCDQETDGGGWIVFQRRKDGSVNFYRGWKGYKTGFGERTGEFWLGNEKIYRLLNNSMHELRVDIRAGRENAYAKYHKFKIGPETDGYRLTAQEYSGNAGNALWYHSGMQFSTKNRDHDFWTQSCAMRRKGGWWYNACCWANLNGRFRPNVCFPEQDIIWTDWNREIYSIRFSEMKFREHVET